MKGIPEMDGIIRTYIEDVGKRMSYTKRVKKLFLKELTRQIKYYCTDHPDATLEDLYAEFGDPETFSEDLADNARYREMIRTAKKKTVLFIVLSVVLALAAAVAVGFVIRLIWWYSVTGVVISEIRTVPVD